MWTSVPDVYTQNKTKQEINSKIKNKIMAEPVLFWQWTIFLSPTYHLERLISDENLLSRYNNDLPQLYLRCFVY